MTAAHAIRFHETGGPEVMRYEPVTVGQPGPGEVLLRQTAVGVNFQDIANRIGRAALPLPSGLGSEACGVVEAVGPGVADFKEGDRVAYGFSGPAGAYASHRVMPVAGLVPVPAGVSDEQAAAVLAKGLTAQYLVRQTFPVARDTRVLYHAAAGGVGLIACQWMKHLGANVIGTVGGPDKAAVALAHGCAHVIDYNREDFVARVGEITGGRKVQVVYDSVGKATFLKSLDCLAPLGMMVLFGQASGGIEPVDLRIFQTKGSLSFCRPSLQHYISGREKLLAMAAELFGLVASGAIRVHIGLKLPLSEAAEAHRRLESRATVGSVVLVP